MLLNIILAVGSLTSCRSCKHCSVLSIATREIVYNLSKEEELISVCGLSGFSYESGHHIYEYSFIVWTIFQRHLRNIAKNCSIVTVAKLFEIPTVLTDTKRRHCAWFCLLSVSPSGLAFLKPVLLPTLLIRQHIHWYNASASPKFPRMHAFTCHLRIAYIRDVAMQPRCRSGTLFKKNSNLKFRSCFEVVSDGCQYNLFITCLHQCYYAPVREELNFSLSFIELFG